MMELKEILEKFRNDIVGTIPENVEMLHGDNEFCLWCGHPAQQNKVIKEIESLITEAYEAGYSQCWDEFKNMPPYKIGFQSAIKEMSSKFDRPLAHEGDSGAAPTYRKGWNQCRIELQAFLTSLQQEE